MSTVLVSRLETPPGVVTITLNRPEVGNACSAQLYRDLTIALTAAAEDATVTVVVVTGSGKFFTAGADLADGDMSEPSELQMSESAVYKFMLAVIRFPKLLVVAVNGPCVGIGSTLCAHADLVYAAADAWFWTPFFRIALVPEFASSQLWVPLLGRSRANAMLYLGKRLSAAEAATAGFVVETFPKEELLPKVYAELQNLLETPVAGKSILHFKKMLNGNQAYLEQLCLSELEILKTRITDGDAAEAVQKMMETRAKLSAAKAAKL